MEWAISESNQDFLPFSILELNMAMKYIKTGKVARSEGIAVQMILHFGDRRKEWLLALFNKCATTYRTPKIRKRAKLVSLVKPGKDPLSPKIYRQILPLCITYRLYEGMIMARLSPKVEGKLSTDPADFWPGQSCCSQVQNLTQYIEDGFENRQFTGTAFVDLTPAYDTINNWALLLNVTQTVEDINIVWLIESLLVNRRFFVELDSKKSKWGPKRTGSIWAL